MTEPDAAPPGPAAGRRAYGSRRGTGSRYQDTATRLSAQALVQALDGRWHGRYGTARCPSHDDRRPSLSIREGGTAPLLKCFAGCENSDIIDALRRRELWGHTNNREPRPIRPKRQRDPEPKPADVELRARRILCRAEPADPSHPYLTAKDIQPHEAWQRGGQLVLPLIRDAQLRGLQLISPDGRKRFLRGSRLRGSYWFIGDPVIDAPGGRIAIAEGFATAASVNAATGLACIIAFSAGNLRPVAESWRRTLSEAEIIIAADNDKAGQRAAAEAARAVNGRVVRPGGTGNG